MLNFQLVCKPHRPLYKFFHSCRNKEAQMEYEDLVMVTLKLKFESDLLIHSFEKLPLQSSSL